MDAIDSLVAAFRAETRDRNGAVQDLLPHARDPRVFEVLLGAIADPAEDPMARTAALRHFEHASPPPSAADRDRLTEAMPRVLTRGTRGGLNDQLVLEHAARALTNYAASQAVTDALASIMLDDAEEYDLRMAAFDALSNSGEWPERKPLFERLLGDDEMAEEARRLIRIREYRPPV